MLSRLEPSTKVILKVFAGVLIIGLLWFIRDILLILILSLILASALEPFVDSLQTRKIPRTVSVLAVYLVVIAMAIGVGLALLPALISESQNVFANFPSYVEQAKHHFPFFLSFWVT